MRRDDWQERFSSFAKAHASMPFVWGSNDCCSFAASAVLAVTGRDPMASVEAYDNPLAAARLVEAGGGLLALADSLLGPSVPPLRAAIGDVVLLVNEGRELLGVCNGTSAFAPGRDGLVVLDMAAAAAAWKI